MGINWIRVEDELPKDNGHIQKFLVCTNVKTACFQNCDITTCYFTDKFHIKDSDISNGAVITHWARINKPSDLN